MNCDISQKSLFSLLKQCVYSNTAYKMRLGDYLLCCMSCIFQETDRIQTFMRYQIRDMCLRFLCPSYFNECVINFVTKLSMMCDYFMIKFLLFSVVFSADVYERLIRKGKKPSFIQLLVTQTVSAVWHVRKYFYTMCSAIYLLKDFYNNV